MTSQSDTMENAFTNMANTVKEAFAPMTDALKTMDVPDTARDFIKRAALTAKDRTVDFQTGSEKVTAAIETALSGSVGEVAKISRNMQQAFYHDIEAYFSGIEKLASAKSLSEAAQIQTEMVKSAGEAFVARAKSATEYLGKAVADGAKSAQDNVSTVASYAKTA